MQLKSLDDGGQNAPSLILGENLHFGRDGLVGLPMVFTKDPIGYIQFTYLSAQKTELTATTRNTAIKFVTHLLKNIPLQPWIITHPEAMAG